ncbi:ATP-dependent helicase [Italian clover phyllody phytoplasma]|uniref:ATP-dependent helicase n=1 Tax=Italian clover phyllody phytoplasma TaxID=1196420 RepID=UPI00031E5353|nr:UvrD-helicase domain-containing protein [Italian clover phyllody phytoplasma]
MLEKSWLETLNPQQKKAVIYTEGALYVIAGAGTGKTKTLTSRIAYLIQHLNIPYDKFLAITFTNNAAKEMKNRVQNIIQIPNAALNIYTFHAFGFQVLKRFINRLSYSYDSRFNIVDDNDSKKIIKDVVKVLNLDSEKYLPSFLKKQIYLIKTENPHRKDAPPMDHHIEKIYNAYQTYLKNNNLIDFDDLIIYTYELFLNYPEIRTFYQNKFLHVLVDEFQDTDFHQYQILKLLAEKHRNLFAVGDPDQNIYSFRGASKENNDLFVQDFQAKKIILEQNYRSTNNILKKANLLIKKNHNGFGKELKSSLGDGSEVFFNQFVNADLEADFVIKEIDRLVAKNQYRYGDVAILYRYNTLESLFENNLMKKGIPYKILGNISFYQRKEIKDLIAYLKVLMDTDQNFYLQRIINVPSRKIGKVTFQKIEEISQNQNLSFFTALNYYPSDSKIIKHIVSFQTLIQKMKDKLHSHSFNKLEEIVDYVDKTVGYSDTLREKPDSLEAQNALDYIQELKNVFAEANTEFEGTLLEKLNQLLDQISLYSQDKRDGDDQVKLATVHKVKGMEFKVVFIIGFEENIFPLNNSKDPDNTFDLEEERRLAYVAITRAKECLYLTSVAQRRKYGQFVKLEISSFVKEMNFHLTNLNDTYFNKTMKIRPANPHQAFLYQIGDKVEHNTFGRGTVIEIKIPLITISFLPPYGIKKLDIKHPSFKKVESLAFTLQKQNHPFDE